MTPPLRLAIVGQGRVGTALGAALTAAGRSVTSLSSRALPAALHYDAYLLAVRDPSLADVARRVVAAHGAGAVILHTAGAVPSSVARDAGAGSAAVLHPLVSFSGSVPELRGALFALEGAGDALRIAEALVAALGGTPCQLSAEQLARYHAAAALASNHVLALVQIAEELLVSLGIAPSVAMGGLAGLFASVAGNLAQQGLPAALTGPIARGDAAVVARHLAALTAHPEAERAYLDTAPVLCRIARAQGRAPAADLEQIERMVSRLYPVVGVD